MKNAIRYARNNDGQSVAYEVSGAGPLDLVFIPDWVTNLEVMREEPSMTRFFDRLGSFSRLICLDKRGSGLSDPVPLGAIPTIEEWMHDVCTVLDDLGSPRAALLGHGEGGPMALLFAATHPERTHALVLADTCARRRRAPDYPWGLPDEAAERYIAAIIGAWGSGEAAHIGAASEAHRPGFVERRARLERLAMSPGEFAAIYPQTYELDIRPVLGTIGVPTLVLHRSENPYMRVGNARYLVEHIDGATLVELPGRDHFFHAGDTDGMIDHIQQFLTGTREAPDLDRVLATVVFTDIVGATDLAERLGDRDWRDLLGRHHALVRQELERFRGREVDTAGDGFFATFDGPARGVRCALAIRDVVRTLGIEIRAGVHIGECELMGQKVGGIAVHIAARIMAQSKPGEVLVSRTVKDLVAGSGLVFEEAGRHTLRGVAEEWELYFALSRPRSQRAPPTPRQARRTL
jgi:class 3 adenylate cyclase/pimeloyl-ACP methyl ester carboxylesterase